MDRRTCGALWGMLGGVVMHHSRYGQFWVGFVVCLFVFWYIIGSS